MPDDVATAAAPSLDTPAESPANAQIEQGDGTTGESATPDANEGEKSEKGKDRLNARFSELTRARKEAERKAEEKDREAQYWREQVLKGQPQQPETPKAPEPKAKPKPEDFRIEGTNEYDPVAFAEALTDWKVDQRLEAAEKQRQERETANTQKTEKQKVDEAFHARREAFAKEHPEYDEVLSEAGDIQISPVMDYLIRRSEHGPAMALHLAKNPDVAQEIAALAQDPVTTAYRLGLIEARLAGDKPAAEPANAPETPPQSKAPAIEKPISRPSAAAGTVPFDPLNPKSYDGDFGKYEKHMAEWEKKRKGS